MRWPGRLPGVIETGRFNAHCTATEGVPSTSAVDEAMLPSKLVDRSAAASRRAARSLEGSPVCQSGPYSQDDLTLITDSSLKCILKVLIS